MPHTFLCCGTFSSRSDPLYFFPSFSDRRAKMGSPRHIINVQNDRKDDKDVSKNFPYFDIYGPDVHTLSLCLLGFFRFCYLNLHGFSIWIWFLNFWHLGSFPFAFFVLDMILISALFFWIWFLLRCLLFLLPLTSVAISFSMVFQCLYCLVRAKHFPAVKRVLCLLCRPEECGF